jgi:hypothetical protein
LGAIDAMARDIDERSLEHCPARSQSIAIASNNGRSSSAVLARTWFALAARDFRSLSVRPAVVSRVTAANIRRCGDTNASWEDE